MWGEFPSGRPYQRAPNVSHRVGISSQHDAHPAAPRLLTAGTFSVSSIETVSSLILRSRPGGAGQRHVRTSGESEQWRGQTRATDPARCSSLNSLALTCVKEREWQGAGLPWGVPATPPAPAPPPIWLYLTNVHIKYINDTSRDRFFVLLTTRIYYTEATVRDQ